MEKKKNGFAMNKTFLWVAVSVLAVRLVVFCFTHLMEDSLGKVLEYVERGKLGFIGEVKGNQRL